MQVELEILERLALQDSQDSFQGDLNNNGSGSTVSGRTASVKVRLFSKKDRDLLEYWSNGSASSAAAEQMAAGCNAYMVKVQVLDGGAEIQVDLQMELAH